MAKELIYTFNSDLEVETLIDRLEEKVEIRKASLDEGLGYSLRNDDRSLEIHIVPKQEGELFEVVVKTKNDNLENISKEIFGDPKKEAYKDASIMDVAEFIMDLPDSINFEELCKALKERFILDDEKLEFFIKTIIKQASKFTARDYLKKAAKKIHKVKKL